jgi:hypothetical protein
MFWPLLPLAAEGMFWEREAYSSRHLATSAGAVFSRSPADDHRQTDRYSSRRSLFGGPAWVVGNPRERQWACTESQRSVSVQLGVKESMEAIDNPAVPNRKAQLDQLLGVEVGA